MIDIWAATGASPKTGYEAEARSFANLMCTSTSRNLVRVFFLQSRLKAQGNKIDRKIKHVHVVGAGVMGGDICGLVRTAWTHRDIAGSRTKIYRSGNGKSEEAFRQTCSRCRETRGDGTAFARRMSVARALPMQISSSKRFTKTSKQSRNFTRRCRRKSRNPAPSSPAIHRAFGWKNCAPL